MKRLTLRDLGQVSSADIKFGDLTVFVGRQASGKTLFLEMLKLTIDTGYIHSQLTRHGLDWNKEQDAFFDIYLGEGMRSVVTGKTEIAIDGSVQSIDTFVRRRRTSNNRLFYIPAQRVLTVQQGWPQPFQSFGTQDPYVVREFSEQFRLLMDKEFSRGGALFPQTNRLKKAYRDMISDHVFRDFELRIDVHGARRRLVLARSESDPSIPFMTWSAGQREFVPLLMGLYWLMPASKVSRREAIEWAVIEELEAGLHPAAISSVLLIILELLSRGYKVCLSTHSPHILDVVWAVQTLKELGASPDKVLDFFAAPRTPQMREVAAAAIQKEFRVYHFDGTTGVAQDISRLDPASSDEVEANWGGLTEHGGRIADIVADVVAREGKPLQMLGGGKRDLRWVPTGRVAFPRGSRQHVRLATFGIGFPEREVVLR
jgi:hypothetical protein